MKKSKTLKYIISRGPLIGVFLLVFMHAYRMLIVSELSVSEYLSSITTKELLFEGIAMLLSGFVLAYYVRRQIDNLKKAKGEV